ncbi:hypothetical protein [Actinomadura bangladeshensis]|uniref:PH domain-containing protein n=1 Tax=Actinomadura bangladeshensis TaxID=453573 RepID=A0A6L9QEN7_9ACTN|nr:hypothetical protein [Actinomadura bangladeshensis]NEA23735.1 hypothetical protein [Actinomadura bangladeshensis]
MSDSRRPDEAAASSLRYHASPPAGLGVLALLLIIGVLTMLVTPALDAGVPAFWLNLTAAITGALVMSVPERRVELTDGGRLLITGFGQHVDVHASRILAVRLPRRARLGFGSAVLHWDGGKAGIWQAMRYTPEPRSRWSFKHVSGRGGRDFGDLVYRLRAHNPALVVEGVEPPPWAVPPPIPPYPPWWSS